MRNFVLLLFALTGGLTLSGVVANLYRLTAAKPKDGESKWIYYSVMVLAGPSVLLDNSTRSFRRRECSRLAYGFALGLAAYWSFMIGAILVDLAI